MAKRRKNKDKDRSILITILPDGQVLLPRDEEFCLLVAKALGDEQAYKFCEQSKSMDVIIGKRMCG